LAFFVFVLWLKADILPVLVTNHTVTIAAELENGQTLVGQCEISHPSPSITSPNTATNTSKFQIYGNPDDRSEASEDLDENDWAVDAMGGEGGSTANNVHYTKENEHHQPLDAPIRRTLFWIRV
jgi:hypothetical protein